MLIESKHRDYYDSAVGMGIDKTIVYQRHEKEVETPAYIRDLLELRWSNNFLTLYGHDIPKGAQNTDFFIIGFCGKLHLGFKFTKKIGSFEYKTDLIYDHEKAKNKFNLSNKKDKYWKWYSRSRKTDLENYLNFTSKIAQVDPIEWFREFNVPVFVIGNPHDINTRSVYNHNCNTMVLNPVLKDFKFMRVHDPYTAFQEIQMFISGVLGIDKDGDNPPMTEKQKVAQHGMDKWSFRKPPKND